MAAASPVRTSCQLRADPLGQVHDRLDAYVPRVGVLHFEYLTSSRRMSDSATGSRGSV